MLKIADICKKNRNYFIDNQLFILNFSIDYVVDFDSFDNYNAHIYVPCDSKTDYSYDAIWGLFRYIHCIGEETDIESIPSDFPHQRTRKIFRDNKVIILRDGEEYSILGHKL